MLKRLKSLKSYTATIILARLCGSASTAGSSSLNNFLAGSTSCKKEECHADPTVKEEVDKWENAPKIKKKRTK